MDICQESLRSFSSEALIAEHESKVQHLISSPPVGLDHADMNSLIDCMAYGLLQFSLSASTNQKRMFCSFFGFVANHSNADELPPSSSLTVLDSGAYRLVLPENGSAKPSVASMSSAAAPSFANDSYSCTSRDDSKSTDGIDSVTETHVSDNFFSLAPVAFDSVFDHDDHTPQCYPPSSMPQPSAPRATEKSRICDGSTRDLHNISASLPNSCLPLPELQPPTPTPSTFAVVPSNVSTCGLSVGLPEVDLDDMLGEMESPNMFTPAPFEM